MSNLRAQSSFASPELESMVRAARGYVQPTDDLRPKTLEAARDAHRQGRSNRRFFTLGLLVLLLSATGIPGYLFSTTSSLSPAPSAELHRRAALRSVERGVGANWALFEVFSDLRNEQAERLQSED